jgi:hypothetical protein
MDFIRGPRALCRQDLGAQRVCSPRHRDSRPRGPWRPRRAEAGRYFEVDAGTLRLRVDAVDGDVHRVGSTDPVVAFKVASIEETLTELATRDVYAHRGPFNGPHGSYAELRDPDGRAVILTEAD